MFGQKKPPVQIGDRFIKAEDPARVVYRVSRIWTPGGGLPHALLAHTGRQRETLIMSVSALWDRQLFMPDQ